MNAFLANISVLDGTLILGIMWLSGVFIWLLKRFIRSYDDNTRTLTAINSTLQVMDKKLDTATTVDREILIALAHLNSPIREIG